MTQDRQQFYLRAEPTPESREQLRAHQEHLARVFEDLRVNPRRTRADDLHWTAIFLGSPERWTRAFRTLRQSVDLTTTDLLDLTIGNAPLPAKHPERFHGAVVRPTGYDVFFKGRTTAIVVVTLDRSAEAPIRAVFDHLRERLKVWEREGRIAPGAAAAFPRHAHFPLARERSGGRPHITLARGRVRPDRHRDVARTIRATPLAPRDPLTFLRTELRAVRSPAVLATYA